MRINKKDKKLKTMLTIAADSPSHVRNVRLAAGIFFKNKLIAVGYPQKKTHPMQARYTHVPSKTCVHAEIDAISKAINRIGKKAISDAELVVARAAYVSDQPTSKSRSATARPCPGCFNAISAYGITKIRWTEDSFDQTEFF